MKHRMLVRPFALLFGGVLILVVGCQDELTRPAPEQATVETTEVSPAVSPPAGESAPGSTVCAAYRKRLANLEGGLVEGGGDPETDAATRALRDIVTNVCG